MKITKVTYSALVNLGNYENEKIELEGEVEEGEKWTECLEDLKLKVRSNLRSQERYFDYCRRFDEQRKKLIDIEQKLQKAYEQWEEVSSFLKAQGLKPDAPKFPFAKQNLITAGVESVDAEIDDNEDWERPF